VVHKDLDLSAEQLKQLVAVNDRIDMPMWSMRNKTPQHLIKTVQESTAATKSQLASLLSKEQNERIEQIELWVLGMKSLLRNDVAAKMKLEPQQRTEIRDVITTAQQGMVDLRKQLNAGGDADELNKQFRKLQVDQQQDTIALLTPEQKQEWVALLGKRIDLTKLGRIRFKAPELQSGAGWVNSEPLTMEQLKGKVVALHFYAFA
jgi:Spy/CpxP family protein refolding chaperone